MSDRLDEDVVQRVNDLGATPWTGTTYRYTSRGRDPLSGTGARMFGGRWNPRAVFSTIYLAQPAATAAGEFKRMASAAGMPPQAMIANGYELHTLEVHGLAVLDLRTPAALKSVGLDAEDISDWDWTACQSVGHAAWFLEMGGILAPSASGTGLVLAAFDSRLRPGQVRHADSRLRRGDVRGPDARAPLTVTPEASGPPGRSPPHYTGVTPWRRREKLRSLPR